MALYHWIFGTGRIRCAVKAAIHLVGSADVGNTHIFLWYMPEFIDQLRPIAELYANEFNLEVYDITLARERHGRVLRISLDGDVTLDGCSHISKAISNWIDSQQEDFIPFNSYQLEITSLGIDRPLRTQKEFESKKGKLCRIETKSKDKTGRKRYKGRIKTTDTTHVTIYTEEENSEFSIAYNDIKKAQAEIEL